MTGHEAETSQPPHDARRRNDMADDHDTARRVVHITRACVCDVVVATEAA